MRPTLVLFTSFLARNSTFNIHISVPVWRNKDALPGSSLCPYTESTLGASRLTEGSPSLLPLGIIWNTSSCSTYLNSQQSVGAEVPISTSLQELAQWFLGCREELGCIIHIYDRKNSLVREATFILNRKKPCNSQLHLSVPCNIWLRANEEKLDNFLFRHLLRGQCPILQRSGHETFITKARAFTAALSKWCVLVHPEF